MYVAWLKDLRMSDLPRVGGKNAALGEMIGALAQAGIRVPAGFATTAQAYRDFLAASGLDGRIARRLQGLDPQQVEALAACGAEIRAWILAAPFPPGIEKEIRSSFQELIAQTSVDLSFAIRSSATAEDLPEASFAGQQETYLNIRGADNTLEAVRRVFASLYTDRAISYRAHHGFAHDAVAISVAVQQMVRSDLGASGVMFTLDTESGFRDVVFINSTWGLGEMLVQGAVNPDEFYVHKPMLERGRPAIVRRALGSKAQKLVFADAGAAGRSTRVADVPAAQQDRFSLEDGDVLELARYGVAIERHYGRPMDIEWARDGLDGKLYVLQARPETVKSRKHAEERYALKGHSKVLATGRAIGHRIGSGAARVVAGVAEISRVKPGDVIVTDMTDPDWEPVMKIAAGIVTNRGGRTCHAAIIARELGIPAIVGCVDATRRLKDGQPVTVSCAEGDTGNVYEGLLPFEVSTLERGEMPEIPVKIAMNVGNPQLAFDFAQLPNAGVGLARLEFIIANEIGVHPRACLEYPDLPAELKRKVESACRGYANPTTFFRERMAEGVATIAAAFWPKQVIVRLSDFKSNEYRKLLGGERYEPEEENPMLGWRGAARFITPSWRSCFELECAALRKVRDELGFVNVEIMVPFVRTVKEARETVELLAANGLRRGENGLRIVMMCELPSNVMLADEFLQYFDGFSIGSNDLTQLTLGLDRDSELVAASFDERDAAVKALLALAIRACRRQGKYVGICGQGPSDHPDLARWLMEQGIESLSLNPDTVVSTWLALAEKPLPAGEKRRSASA
ncbi:MAG: phosphoenolpyruvate synthase [Betaproteobacteria bacterium RIFCSPHIGHO2_12_FULL_69_13]|nr:MAG: phosphoenolpyruvate synthase [Betaproteobacteria bacterium RIFCSPHIGHO2_12_FULL_69_13]OGA67245.1 MAG: phosphoenolpyruvate synthase [Betaproteobacteria bacterium RIFCSPLOWO2_12_FULL_68_20]